MGKKVIKLISLFMLGLNALTIWEMWDNLGDKVLGREYKFAMWSSVICTLVFIILIFSIHKDREKQKIQEIKRQKLELQKQREEKNREEIRKMMM